ncbi:MAG: ADP-ribosylglycohydrolase family protein [Akkermansiaceae bacterium]|jgi:ADP-ribosylglycohydrolase
MRDHAERLASARESLEGLSVGDAIGEALSYRFYEARENCDFSAFRDGTVRYTDDTEMAIAIVETLSSTRTIEEDLLAWAFGSRFRRDPDRGYGKMARRILTEISAGTPWEEVSKNAFGGGSFGNGAAMRVAPLGAYFADEIQSIPEIATRSARVTHYHPEGIAGAIAVAVATAAALGARSMTPSKAADSVWNATIDLTPESSVRRKMIHAKSMGFISNIEAARELGNGAEISAQDTVPFCIWNACRCLGEYHEAILSTIEVGGDCDTNSAIVGGIVS